MSAVVPRLRPVVADDLALFHRFAVEPGLVGLDWRGFRDPQAAARRFAVDGWLGTEDGRLVVSPGDTDTAAGFVSWRAGSYDGVVSYWEIGIALLPEWRGQGLGWRAQALLCDYLFEHTPAQRIQAGTHAENTAEQRSSSRPASPSKAWSAPASSAPASGATATSTAASAPTRRRPRRRRAFSR